MYYNLPSMVPYEGYRNYRIPQSYKSLEEALDLVRKSVQGEREDELFYDYLISKAPSQEEKNIITRIRDDERKHNKMFKEIYKHYTSMNVASEENEGFERPKSYIDGIKRALFGELKAAERYRIIHAGIPDRYYRDMVFEILTDELIHADKYNYLLISNLQDMKWGERIRFRSSVEEINRAFSIEDAAYVANQLQIDFTKEKFNIEELRQGLNFESKYDSQDPTISIAGNNPVILGKLVVAHLRKTQDFYTRLKKLEL